MEQKIIGTARLKCRLCGKNVDVSIKSDIDKYTNDYTSLTKLGHVCENFKPESSPMMVMGKLDVVGIYFDSNTIKINADEDSVISFTNPPLEINWGKTDE